MTELDRLDPRAVPSVTRRWEVTAASGLNLLVGVWLLISPSVLAYDGDGAAYPRTAGALVVLVASARVTVAAAVPWVGWIGAALGVAIGVGAVVRQTGGAATINELASGTLVAVLAAFSAAASAAAARGRPTS